MQQKIMSQDTGILLELKSYDFNTPINTTILFDESDEETDIKPKIKIESCDDSDVELVEDNRMTPIIQPIENSEAGHETNIKYEADRSQQIIEDNRKTPILEPLFVNRTINNEEQLSPIKNNSRKRTFEETVADSFNTKRSETKDMPSIDINDVYEENPEKACLAINNISANNVPIQNNNVLLNVDELLAKAYEKVTETDKLVSESYQILLKTVSEHLLYIFQNYEQYRRILCAHRTRLNQNASHISIKNEWAGFNKSKYYLFDLSYSTVVAIILPKLNDSTFVSKFLNNTLNMINSNTSLQVTKEQLKQVYQEMINYVKKKKSAIYNRHKVSSNIMLQKMLETPNKDINKGSQERPNKKVQKPKCLFAAGPPDCRVVITTLANSNDYVQPIAMPPVINNNLTKYNTSLSNYQSAPLEMRNIPLEDAPALPTVSKCSSTDSGFGSPSPLNTYINPTAGAPPHQDCTPLITHVTSLNPNVTRSEQKQCRVCGVATSTVCLGCFTVHYCSYQCQNHDWSIHKFYCTFES